MQYAAVKKKHPNLKVRNAKKLIEAIRESDPVDLARARAEKNPLKVNGRIVVCTDTMVESADEIRKSKFPLVFDMETWLGAAEVPNTEYRFAYETASCGTAACIAGFAGALMMRGRGKKSESDVRLVDRVAGAHGPNRGWVLVLAEFLGIDPETARAMTTTDDSVALGGVGDHDVRPRHAVRLLEIFLETGRVDWVNAMGRRRVGDECVATYEEKARARDDLDALRAAA